jgi:hypothetical protein
MQVKEKDTVFRKKQKKYDDFFQYLKPKPIQTENRHLSKDPIPIPTEVKKSIPQGSGDKAQAPSFSLRTLSQVNLTCGKPWYGFFSKPMQTYFFAI